MYDKIQGMSGGPEWHESKLTLPDAPNEPQTLYSRNIIECAHFLFENPTFAGSMDYAHRRVTDEKGKQIYNEMATGDDWKEIQVCFRNL